MTPPSAPPATTDTTSGSASESAPALPAKEWFPGLDGLRGIALLIVFTVHLPFPVIGGYLPLKGGYIAMNLFFVLSGFLITTLLIQEHRSTGRIAIGRFYARRAVRLLPVVLMFTAAIFVLTEFEPTFKTIADDARRHAIGGLSYAYNWIAIHSFNRGNADAVGFVGPLWSLSVEEQFYLLFPLLLFIVLRRRSRSGGTALPLPGAELARRFTGFVPALVVGIVASALAMFLIGFVFEERTSYERAMWGTDTRAGGFLIGALCAIVRLVHPAVYQRIKGHLGPLAAVATVIFTVSCFAFPFRPNPLPFAGGLLLIDLCVAVIVLSLVERSWRPLSWMLEQGWIKWVGKVSYGAYVVHSMLIWRFYHQDETFFRLPYPSILAMTMIIAAVSFYAVEQPLSRWLRRRYRL